MTDGNDVDSKAADAIVIEEISGQEAVAAGENVFVLTGATYADNAAMEAAINTGGARQITFGAAVDANDDIIVVWSTTSGNTVVSSVNVTTAGTTIAADATVTDIVELTGVDASVGGVLNAANFDFI